MGLKSFLKGLDSRPTTPQIGSVPLPDLVGGSDEASLKPKRPRTPSFLKKRLLPSFRPATPLKRAESASTTSSALSSLHDGDISPMSSEDGEKEQQYFHIAPDSPSPQSRTPLPLTESPTRHATPRPIPSRNATPKPRALATSSSPFSVTSVAPMALSLPNPSSIPALEPSIPSTPYRAPKPPLSARSSTPAPPRSAYEIPKQPRRASTPAPRTPGLAGPSRTVPLTSPQPTANNALVPVNHFPSNAELHWQLLQYDPARGKPRLYFDVAHEPSLIRVFNKYMRPLMPDDKHKPAANVPLTEMTIRVAPLPLPAWDIRVRRPDGGTLRCADVFNAIYESLNTPLSDSEKGQWASEYMDACEPFFKARCKASTALTDWEERQGLRRVDLLKGRTRFKGIARASPEKTYWVLHLDKQHKP